MKIRRINQRAAIVPAEWAVYVILFLVLLAAVIYFLSPKGTFGGVKDKVVSYFDSVMLKLGVSKKTVQEPQWTAEVLGMNRPMYKDGLICYTVISQGTFGASYNSNKGVYELQQKQGDNWISIDSSIPTDDQIYDKDIYQTLSDVDYKLSMDFDGKKYRVYVDSLLGLRADLDYIINVSNGVQYNFALRDVPYLQLIRTNGEFYDRESTQELQVSGRQDLLDIYDGLFHSIRGLDFTIKGNQFSELELYLPRAGSDIIAYVQVGDYYYGISNGHYDPNNAVSSREGYYYITADDFKNGKSWTKLSSNENQAEFNLMSTDSENWQFRIQLKQLKADLIKACDEG